MLHNGNNENMTDGAYSVDDIDFIKSSKITAQDFVTVIIE